VSRARAERLRVLLDVYGPGSGSDPHEAMACLSPADRRNLAACGEEDRALLNACLEAEGELRARGYAALARLGSLAPVGFRNDRQWIARLPEPDGIRAISAIYELGWAYAPPEVERVG
jgi:hypothetical protein